MAILGAATANTVAPAGKVIASVDLAKPFGTRSPWHFAASQGSDIGDQETPSGSREPGPIKLCLSNDKARSCRPDLQAALRENPGEDFYAEAHFLENVEIVRPHGAAAPPLLLLQTASWHGGNGDQRVTVQALAYKVGSDSFTRIYGYRTNRNRNEEIRYVAEGPLRGDIVSAEPTDDAPFGFWITVNKLTPDYTYRQILRFRSATRYNDGNSLAVIDSEMPNIHKRLGLWRAGLPLPLPARRCPKPHLIRMELWCA